MRLAHLDFTELARPSPPILSQIVFGVLCSAFAIVLRMLTDIWLPGAGPFALTVPLVLVATLFGRWIAGLVCQTIVSLHAWYFVLPIVGSFEFANAADGPRVLVNLVAGYFVVALAEIFRRAVRQALTDREALLLELEHRVRNSFASIAGVLRLQLRSTTDQATQQALHSALGRVESFARAYSLLYYRHDRSGEINIQGYLQELCRALEATATPTRQVRFECDAAEAYLPRDRAIAIGLLVNEVSTNSLKHAFGDSGGEISVRFRRAPAAYELLVADNGKGMSEDQRPGSLGLQLINALTVQASGTVAIDTDCPGTTFRFEFSL